MMFYPTALAPSLLMNAVFRRQHERVSMGKSAQLPVTAAGLVLRQVQRQ